MTEASVSPLALFTAHSQPSSAHLNPQSLSIHQSPTPTSTPSQQQQQQHRRKRQRTQDPTVKPEFSHHCQSLEEAQSALRQYINVQTGLLIPEHVQCQLTIPVGASFAIGSTAGERGVESESNEASKSNKNKSVGFQTNINGHKAHSTSTPTTSKADQISTEEQKTATTTTSISLSEVLDISHDDKKRHEVQHAVARTIVSALEEVDEFRYTRRNSWETKAKDGIRVTYTCFDSLQNHDRSANRSRKKKSDSGAAAVAGTTTGTNNTETRMMGNDNASAVEEGTAIRPANQGSDGSTPNGNGAKKSPSQKVLTTYDCGGCITVRFMALQQCVVVIYSHDFVHRKMPADERERLNMQSAALSSSIRERAKKKKAKEETSV